MGMFANLFTWWNGASLGTTIVTRARGEEVGTDDAGNTYFRHRSNPARRWVIYEGSNDSSRVPPAWNAWLRGTVDDVPEKSMPPRRQFEKDPRPNMTGTIEAHRPAGSLMGKGQRAASTGDYEAWQPE